MASLNLSWTALATLQKISSTRMLNKYFGLHHLRIRRRSLAICRRSSSRHRWWMGRMLVKVRTFCFVTKSLKTGEPLSQGVFGAGEIEALELERTSSSQLVVTRWYLW